MESEPMSVQEQLRPKSPLINSIVDRLPEDEQIFALCSGGPGVFGVTGPRYGVYVLTSRQLLWRNLEGQSFDVALSDVQQIHTSYISQYCVYIEVVTHGGHETPLALSYGDDSSGKDFCEAVEQALRTARQVHGAPAAAAGPSVADELEKLDGLRQRGVLTDAEFESQKRTLLGI